jgi:hypothetical protein
MKEGSFVAVISICVFFSFIVLASRRWGSLWIFGNPCRTQEGYFWRHNMHTVSILFRFLYTLAWALS